MRAERRILLVMTVVAFGLRLWWVLAADRHGYGLNDSYFYQSAAQQLLDGKGYNGINGQPTAQWPPGYPVILAGLTWFFGPHPIMHEVFNAFVGAATVPLLFLVARRQFDTRVGLLCAGMLTVMPGPILWTDLTITETLYTFLFVLFLLLLTRARPTLPWALAVGAYIGLVALVRSEAVMWVVVPLVVWWRGTNWRVALPRFGVALVSVLLVLLPWSIRNTVVMDTFVPLSSNAGPTLWSGHNPTADGKETYPSQELLDSLTIEGVPTEIAWSKGLQRLAFEYMRSHPLEELELIPKKLLMLVRGDSWAMTWVNAGPTPAPAVSGTTTRMVSVLADAAFYALLTLTLVGVFTLGRRTWRLPLMTAIAATFGMILVLYGFLYYGNFRYRLPYEPAMMIVASLVVLRARDGLRAARLVADAEPVPDADAAAIDASTDAGSEPEGATEGATEVDPDEPVGASPQA